MTSHKEQPAVDTSAKRLLELADSLSTLILYLSPRAPSSGKPIHDTVKVLRSLAAHPPEPEGMELETTAEEQFRWLAGHAHLSRGSTQRLLRDLTRWRARAEKVEATLATYQQPVGDEEVEKLRKLALAATPGPWEVDEVKSDGGHISYEVQAVSDQWWVNGKSIVDTYNSGLIEIQQESDEDGTRAWDEVGRRNTEYIAAANPGVVIRIITQLRDAQARGKGMEEANARLQKPLEMLFKWFEITGSSIDARWTRIPPVERKAIVDATRAALSRPEGSAT